MTSNTFNLLKQLGMDLVYFPVWWYSWGFLDFLTWLKNFLIQKERGLSFFVWLKNIFTPMYGQKDVTGILISVFMRVIQIIFRGVILLFWLLFCVVIFIAWIFMPLVIVYNIIYQLI